MVISSQEYSRRRQALLSVAGRESVESFRQRTALAEGIAAGLG